MKVKYKVPFYSNTLDNTHCFQAVIRMILKYFIPDKNFSRKELDKMTNKKKGLWTWPTRGFINLMKMGFEIQMIGTFSYKKFSERGSKYLIEWYGEKAGEVQIKNSDIPSEMKEARGFDEMMNRVNRLPDISDIKEYLNKKYLIGCEVNHHSLYGLPGYAGHFVLIIGFGNNHFYIHDPGLPPRKNRKVTFERFNKAWAYPDEKVKNLAAFKLASKL